MEFNEDVAKQYAKQYGQVVAKAWADEAFKARLLAEPAAVLREEGITMPEGVELRAVENTNSVMYLTLPPKPSEDLTDEQLNQVAGGSSASTVGSLGSFACVLSCLSTGGTVGCAGSAG